ncbi:MAG: putative amidohydrolase YtcJ [Cyclobacteriaceae bacterium]|jgi:predicted amidohydrolase YtcJ
MMKNLYLIALLGTLMIVSCSQKAEISADLIISGGSIYTGNADQAIVEAVAVLDDQIIGLGSKQEMKKYQGTKTKSVDLSGATMYPGFIEGHAHIMGIGQNLINIDLMETKNFSELIDIVVERAELTPKGEWIIGRGWHQDKWTQLPEGASNGFPIHDALSAAVPDHPVYLKHASGHMSLVNAKAMELAKINSNTPDPAGGAVIKGLGKQPTGILNETAQGLVVKYIPEETELQLEQTLRLAVQACLENGITGFHQAGSSLRDINLFKKFAAEDELKLRMFVMLNGRDDELLDMYFEKGIEVDSMNKVTIRSVKLYSDGALGSRGAWLLEPYSDSPTEYGHNVTPMERVEAITMKAAAAGFQVCIHAIGDRGNREVLDIYERAISTYPEQMADHRFRIEHAQHINGDDIPRFAEMNVIPAMQAIHMASDRPWAIDRLGKERIEEGAYVWQSLLQQGSRIVNGTDAPVEPVSPLASFYASVSRRTLTGTPDNGYEPDQKMTREQALRSYTLDAAYGAFEEELKGSIEVGKLADFTILDKDIMTIPEDDILKTEVVMTIIGGTIVYQAN